MKQDAFTSAQRMAILDLAVLAMYADRKVAWAEDRRVQRLLGELGFGTQLERNREFDAAVARVRGLGTTPERAAAHADQLARQFVHPAQRRWVYDMLSDLMLADGEVAAEESRFLARMRERFEISETREPREGS